MLCRGETRRARGRGLFYLDACDACAVQLNEATKDHLSSLVHLFSLQAELPNAGPDGLASQYIASLVVRVARVTLDPLCPNPALVSYRV